MEEVYVVRHRVLVEGVSTHRVARDMGLSRNTVKVSGRRGGGRRKAHMFVVRLMHSKRDFAWLYPRQDQTCFLDGHVRAFAHFGAVPHRLAYDNLKAAGAKMLVGSERELSARFLALANHYLFEASFARPRTGHDKGGVEARGKGIRWQELVPIPSGPDLATISVALMSRLDGRVDATFTDERAAMLPLPSVSFASARCVPCASVSRRSLVKLDGAVYPVWSTWAGLDVAGYVGADEVTLVGPDGTRVTHARKVFDEVRAALASGEPLQLAVRTEQPSTSVPRERLPSNLSSVEVEAGDVTDDVTWLGGMQ